VQNRFISLLSGVAILSMADLASAQVTINVSAPVTVTSPVNGDLQQYVVALDSDGAPVIGFDIRLLDPDEIPSVHQVQLIDEFGRVPSTRPSPFENSSGLNSDARRSLDTHLLFNADELSAAGANATEGVGGAEVVMGNDGPVRVQRFGGGVALVAESQGILSAAQQDPLPLLQVILRPGDVVVLTGIVEIEGETTPRRLPGGIIPEPGCLRIAGQWWARLRPASPLSPLRRRVRAVEQWNAQRRPPVESAASGCTERYFPAAGGVQEYRSSPRRFAVPRRYLPVSRSPTSAYRRRSTCQEVNPGQPSDSQSRRVNWRGWSADLEG
jgi:hypothetical protein